MDLLVVQASLQLLYKFPNDPIVEPINYYIARCYEEMQNYLLAHEYYNEVIQMGNQGSSVYKAAEYRDHYIYLLSGNSDQLLKKTEKTSDPYLMTFRGYAYMKKLEWEKARTSFISAQESFNHAHYDDLMIPLYQTIENVNSVPRYNKYLVFLTSALFPGGGQFLLKEWNNGQGILSSVGLMLLISNWAKVDQLVGSNRVIDNYSSSVPLFSDYNKNKDRMPNNVSVSYSSVKYIIPPVIVASGVFLGSSLKSFKDTDSKNKRLLEYYINDKIENLPPSRFLDFPEPVLIFSR